MENSRWRNMAGDVEIFANWRNGRGPTAPTDGAGGCESPRWGILPHYAKQTQLPGAQMNANYISEKGLRENRRIRPARKQSQSAGPGRLEIYPSVQNKANFRGFWARNEGPREKQSQSALSTSADGGIVRGAPRASQTRRRIPGQPETGANRPAMAVDGTAGLQIRRFGRTAFANFLRFGKVADCARRPEVDRVDGPDESAGSDVQKGREFLS
jgi:hypothetical protein